MSALRGFIDITKEMYEGTVMSVRTITEREEFPTTMGLHQGSTLSSSLFQLIVDELSAHIQKEVLWFMMFAENIALDESRDGVDV